MSGPVPIRVVGVGSPHGDDAVGWEVVGRLRQNYPALAAHAELHRVDGGQRLLELLDGCGTLVVIDAVAPADTPGRIVRLEWPDAAIAALRAGSTHDLRPAEALRLAEALGTLPPRVVVFGVEAARLEPGADLSAAVAVAVPEVVQRIAAEIGPADRVAAVGPSNGG